MRYVAENNEVVDLLLTPEEIELQWEKFLAFIVEGHREKYPEDPISTPELCEVFIQRLINKGFIEQNEEGVYQLCLIILSN